MRRAGLQIVREYQDTDSGSRARVRLSEPTDARIGHAGPSMSKKAKAFPVPSDHGFGLDDDECGAPVSPHSEQSSLAVCG